MSENVVFEFGEWKTMDDWFFCDARGLFETTQGDLVFVREGYASSIEEGVLLSGSEMLLRPVKVVRAALKKEGK